MKECKIDGCADRAVGRGMCWVHYQRTLRGTDLNAPIWKRNGERCVVAKCKKPARYRGGYCITHYEAIMTLFRNEFEKAFTEAFFDHFGDVLKGMIWDAIGTIRNKETNDEPNAITN